MDTIRATKEVSVTIPIGEVLEVIAPVGSTAIVEEIKTFSVAATVTGGSQIFGTYPGTTTLRIRCTAGAVTYEVRTVCKTIQELYARVAALDGKK